MLLTPAFSRDCQDVDAAVRWLSKENVVQRVFELREEISLFLRIHALDTGSRRCPLRGEEGTLHAGV